MFLALCKSLACVIVYNTMFIILSSSLIFYYHFWVLDKGKESQLSNCPCWALPSDDPGNVDLEPGKTSRLTR